MLIIKISVYISHSILAVKISIWLISNLPLSHSLITYHSLQDFQSDMSFLSWAHSLLKYFSSSVVPACLKIGLNLTLSSNTSLKEDDFWRFKILVSIQYHCELQLQKLLFHLHAFNAAYSSLFWGKRYSHNFGQFTLLVLTQRLQFLTTLWLWCPEIHCHIQKDFRITQIRVLDRISPKFSHIPLNCI